MVDRQFAASTPNRLWVADFTYVPTWAGMVYVAFIVDAFSRRILGWRAATRMTTPLVLDCLEHALWTRTRDGVHNLTGLVHHTDAGSQYTSIDVPAPPTSFEHDSACVVPSAATSAVDTLYAPSGMR